MHGRAQTFLQVILTAKKFFDQNFDIGNFTWESEMAESFDARVHNLILKKSTKVPIF